MTTWEYDPATGNCLAKRHADGSRYATAYAPDGLEAVVQHNESDLSTWEENEFELNLHYAEDRVGFSPALSALREAIREDTTARIAEVNKEQGEKLC